MNDNPMNPTASTNPHPKGSPAAKAFAEAADEKAAAISCEQAAVELDAKAKELRVARDRHANRCKVLLEQIEQPAAK